MFQTKNQFLAKVISKSFFNLVLLITITFFPIMKKSYALSHEWVGVPKSKYGEQLWDKKSIKRNKDGSVRVLSKFIPKTKNQITKDIFYTMDINCFEKSFRDLSVATEEVNDFEDNISDWQGPNGDQLILGVINQVCNYAE